jgi:hypothetical protein
MKRLLFALLSVGLTLAVTSTARADTFTYDVSTVTYITHIPYEFSFTETSLLSATTTILGADMTVITSPGCTINFSTFTDPLSMTPKISEGLGSPCLSSNTVGFTGPFDHVGSYSNGAQLPTILTISSVSVPEPSAFLLLGSGLLALVGTIRKKL